MEILLLSLAVLLALIVVGECLANRGERRDEREAARLQATVRRRRRQSSRASPRRGGGDDYWSNPDLLLDGDDNEPAGSDHDHDHAGDGGYFDDGGSYESGSDFSDGGGGED